MLTEEMKKIVTDHSVGMVATIDDSGRPMVSPKATFVIVDDATIAYGNISSLGTLANLARRPEVEICFIDTLTRKALRVTGGARIVVADEPVSPVAGASSVSASASVSVVASVAVSVAVSLWVSVVVSPVVAVPVSCATAGAARAIASRMLISRVISILWLLSGAKPWSWQGV